MKSSKIVKGASKPRLGSRSLKKPSKFDEVEAFAKALGWELMPWQVHVLTEALRYEKNGDWSRSMVGVLVARQQGKSALMRLRLLAGIYLWEETWIAMAQTLKQAEHQLYQAYDDLVAAGLWDSSRMKFYQANGRQSLKIGRGSWTILAANRDAVRGFTGSLWVDELREIPEEAWTAALPVTTSYPNAQVYVTSNAGSDHSTVLNELRSTALTFQDDSFGWFEWSADPELSHLDVEGWKQANPALGYRTKVKVLEDALKTSRMEAFLTERLCRWVRALESPWVYGTWEACHTDDLKFEPSEHTYFGLDVSIDRRRADLVAAQKDGDKVKFGLVRSWVSDDGVIDDVKIASDVAEIMRKFATVSLGYDKWTTGSIGSRLASARFNVIDVSGARFAQACDETLTGLNSGRLQHTGNDILTAHFMACVKKPAADGGWRVIRKDSHTSISAAVASIIAIHHASEPAQEISFAF